MSILTARAPMCALRCRHNNGILISSQVAGAFIHTSAAAAPAQSPPSVAAWPPLLALGVNSPPPCLRLVWDVWEIPSLASPPSPLPPVYPFCKPPEGDSVLSSAPLSSLPPPRLKPWRQGVFHISFDSAWMSLLKCISSQGLYL